MTFQRVLKWAGQAVLVLVTFTLAIAIILIVTSGEKLALPKEAFAVSTPLLIVVLGYFLNKMILKNREETQKARDVMLEEIRTGLKEILETTRACLPRQKRETMSHEGHK